MFHCQYVSVAFSHLYVRVLSYLVFRFYFIIHISKLGVGLAPSWTTIQRILTVPKIVHPRSITSPQ
uniref:Putative ovule protein n=1 Tax=Solanum chacoense TaxID=4108 RepID=A0A0V0GNP8_SOLCH